MVETNRIEYKRELYNSIEITSSCSLPEGLSEDEFFEGISAPRNKELMRIYRDLELVEQLGSGVPRILQVYDRSCFYNIRESKCFIKNRVVIMPTRFQMNFFNDISNHRRYKFFPNFIRMTFPKNQEEEEGGIIGGIIGGTIGSEMDGAIGGAIGGAMGGAIGGAIEELTDRQFEILKLINQDSKISYRKVSELLNINYSAAQAHFDTLKEKGIISRIGGTRGSWKINLKKKK